MFETYKTLLTSALSEDYWSDVGIDIASAHVSQFDHSDWRALEAVLLLKPEAWRGRCAESLSDTRDARALRLLLKLLDAKEESVVIHAIESLDALFFAGYIHGARPIVVALGEGFEPSTRTIKLMAATLVRKCGHPNKAG
ncbi:MULTISPECIES: hypothetical protein [unclassified Pseudomonas]|uniref:hypothetical protein n=1 Tax=Pseudomonas TaxID=286 RepID=UPI000BA05672|nr:MULTISPECIES: hypothetical protein [unclassified Pseudomonas]MCV2226238.1 HEAT repeat domain-containing protein [Pseudomonas sp. AU10]OZO01532.1 hypothetical protein B7453_26395 [Pseudomonas sp. IB20]UNM18151.1 HEAT repeat domain-containing protein [Pseudomonas sp. ArH3a]